MRIVRNLYFGSQFVQEDNAQKAILVEYYAEKQHR